MISGGGDVVLVGDGGSVVWYLSRLKSDRFNFSNRVLMSNGLFCSNLDPKGFFSLFGCRC